MAKQTRRGKPAREPSPKELQGQIDRALLSEGKAIDASPSSFHAPIYSGGAPQVPIGSIDAGGESGARLTPTRSIPEPIPHPSQQSPEEQAATYGVSGTPITSAFLYDLNEYNPKLVGRYAIPIWEQIRRDDMGWAVLDVCRRPVQTAQWRVVVKDVKKPITGATKGAVSSNGAGKATKGKAEEIRKFVEDNLMGGLETQTSTGGWATQSWASVIYNATLMQDFGCAVHEEVYHVDGNRITLRALPARQAMTFWRWFTQEDGETLYALEQYGYRGNDFLNVTLPCERFCRFTSRQEGANFFGIPLTRPLYGPWFYKDRLKRIGAVGAERNIMGIPTWRLTTKDASDRTSAENFVTSVVAHEATGVVEPPLPQGSTDKDSGFRFVTCNSAGENLRSLLQWVSYYDICMARAALAMFLTSGSTPFGNKSTAKEHADFFMLAVQNIADQIAWEIQMNTVRRLVWYNFGMDAPMPELQVANVQARQVEDFAQLISQLAMAGAFVSDQGSRDFIREMMALPKETREGLVAIKGETIDAGAPGGPSVEGRSAQPIGGNGQQDQPQPKNKPLFHPLPTQGAEMIRSLRVGEQFKLTSPVMFTERMTPGPCLVVVGALSDNGWGKPQYLKGRFMVRQSQDDGGYIVADQLSTEG
jgi:hypothetical protein